MRVYIAGPISLGDLGQNLRQAVSAANRLMSAGHHPFLPHLSIYWALLDPPKGGTVRDSHDVWLPYDLEWLRQCDALLRLPGASVGADREEVEAARNRIPVYRSVDEFLRYNPARRTLWADS